MDFLHLNVYSGYSYLKSALTVRHIAKHALINKDAYCAIADLHSLRGASELESFCLPRSIQPIYGVAFSFLEGRLVLYFESEDGYRASLPLLAKKQKGELSFYDFASPISDTILVFDSASPSFEETYLRRNKELASFLSPFSSWGDSFYIGLPRNHKAISYFLREFVLMHPYSLLAFPFVAYEKEEDAIALSMLEALERGETLEEQSHSGPYHYLSEQEIRESYTEEECASTMEIARRCANFRFSSSRGKLIRFPLPQGEDNPDSYLRRLAYQGLNRKVPNHDERYEERLEHELSIIKKMGYADYFLIVGDYVSFAKKQGILVGPGRGSGGGSLVSYCLDIVKLDPLRYDLLFERFLNPARQEMPDIDIDFEDTRRDLVIAYLTSRYGEERVSRIETSQTIGAKQALLDAGRIFSFKASDIRLLSSRVDPRFSLSENAKHTFEFAKLLSSDPYYRNIVSLAFKIEGLPRQAGLHAAGIVLNDTPLPDVAPLSLHEGVGYALQLDKDYLQEQGFLKFDLLGLTNLSLISHCLELIERIEGKHLEYEEIPYEDPKAISIIREGKTMGLFQLESPGMNQAIEQISPLSFEDVAACIALYRPGPMQNIPLFAKRKNGKEPISYPCKELEEILKPTYGIFVYQEQIMMASRKLASFSFSEADSFRRAISHKNASVLARLKPAFIEGCQNNGIEKKLAESLYALIERFADYGFNKSHAICYAALTCQMAYLKAYYPLCFYCALLDYGGGGKEKRSRLLREIKKERIAFLLPDINASFASYIPEGKAIRYPLLGIRNVNASFVDALIDERLEHGPFQDFFSFALRMVPKGLKLETLIALIDAGAFDSLDHRRASLRLSAPSAITYGELFGGDANLLHSMEISPPDLQVLEDDNIENLMLEKEAIGMMISGSILEKYQDEIVKKQAHPLDELSSSSSSIWVAGILKNVKTIITKKGTKMCFLELEDGWNVEEFTCFSSLYDRAFPLLKVGTPLFVLGKKDPYRANSFQALDIALIGGK